MRIVRYQIKNEPPATAGSLEDKIGPIVGDIFGEYRRLEAELPLSSVRLLAPLQPSKILCIGRNFVEHAKEHEAEVPKVPLIFMKPPSAIIDPGDPILLPPHSRSRWSTRPSWWS